MLENQSQLAGIVASAMDAIITVDEAQQIVLFNAAAEQMFGCSAADAIGQPLDHFIPERFRAAHRQHIQRFGRTGMTSRKMGHLNTLWALRADGKEFPIEASISQVKADGRAFYTVILRDTTERKQAKAALMENEQRFRSLIEHAPDGIVIYGSSGRIEYASPATSRILGYLPDEIVNTDPAQITHPDDLPGLLLVLNELLQVPEKTVTTQYRMRHKEGPWCWLESNVSNFSNVPGISGLVFNFRDITEDKQAEEILRQNEAQLHHIIDTVPEGVLLLAADGSIRLTNPIAEQFLTLLAPDQENNRLICLGERPLNELLTSPPKGLWHEIATDEYAFEAIARPVEESPDNAGWVLVLRDVTQERDIQRRGQQQERLAAVGQLAAGIAHDFNNIMAVIILYAQIISRTMKMPSRTQEALNTIEKQAKRAADLVQQILDFSRQSVLERQLLDLLPFMKELVKLFNRTLPEHIRIELTDTGEAYFIHADPSRIQQLMMNLAVNARDAMPEGGQLQISLAHVQTEKHKPLPLGDMPPGNWVQIQVADSGSGIPPEVLPQIFEPFFTTKEVGQGTGLGLAQVYGIVQQHEGYIDVATKVGQGTTLTLYFPALDTAESAAGTPDKAALQQGEGQTVLVVEDDLATRKVLVDSLSLMNYEVVEAINGREALAILETRTNDIALVLSDVVMPEMGGIALFHAMRQKNLRIPIVLLTGHPLSKEMENLRILGLAGWLTKPPDLVNLSHLLGQVLAVDSRR